jgi:putative flavoprotein involved in K+ transport
VIRNATPDEVVERLDALAAEAPLQEDTKVTGLAPGYVLQTTDGEIRARAAVVATGDQNVPTIPTVARNLPDHVAQLHTADYAAPGSCPRGPCSWWAARNPGARSPRTRWAQAGA